MSESSSSRSQIPWRTPNCGGAGVNGTDECIAGHSCKCSPKPRKNYYLLMKLLAKAYAEKLHVCTKQKTEAWNRFAYSFCEEIKFKQVQGATLYSQFTSALEDIQKKHAFNDDFQSHGELSEYDKLAIKISEEIKQVEDSKLAEKEKEDKKKQTNLYFENLLGMGPAAPSTSRVASVVGQMIEDAGDIIVDEDSEVTILPETPSFVTPPLKRQKKQKASGSGGATPLTGTAGTTGTTGTSSLIEGLKSAIESIKPSEAVQMRKLDIEERKVALLEKLFEKFGSA